MRAAHSRAVLAHVKGWNPANPSERRLGAGAVNFAASFAALRDIGYNDYVLVELPPDPVDPDAVARQSVQFLKAALQ